MWRTIAVTLIALWIVTLGAAGWVFIKGSTEAGTDGRTAIVLAPADRDFVLAEMRMLLKAVQGSAAGLAKGDRAEAAAAARSGGTAVSRTVEPALAAALPIEFKQMGFAVHESLDMVGMAAEQNEPAEWVLDKLAATLGQCVACHDLYRLEARK